MEVLDSNAGLVSNFELLEILRKKHTVVNDQGRKPVVPLIEAQVIGYLESSPVANVSQKGAEECLARLEKYNLTKAETLQILNLVPTTEVEVHLIVEECAERLSTANSLALLADVKETLLNETVSGVGKLANGLLEEVDDNAKGTEEEEQEGG